MGTVETREGALDSESIATSPDDILLKDLTKGPKLEAQEPTFSPTLAGAPKTPPRAASPNRRNNGVAGNMSVSRRKILGQIGVFQV